MGLFDHLEEAFNTMTGSGDRDFRAEDHEPNRLHEMLAGGAAFAAMRQYENKRAAEGFHDHAMAKELLAAFAGAEVDRMIESRGLSGVDAERAKSEARQQANQMYNSQYGGQQEGYAPRSEGYGGESYAPRNEGYGGQQEGYAPQRGGYAGEGYAPRSEGYGEGYAPRSEGYGEGYAPRNEGYAGEGYQAQVAGQGGAQGGGSGGYSQREGYGAGYRQEY